METQNILIRKITENGQREREDLVAVEAKYHLSINGTEAFSFTCTPSNLEEMVTGALYSRGYIQDAAQITSLEITGSQIHVTWMPNEHRSEMSQTSDIQLDERIIFSMVQSIFTNPDTLFNRTGCAHSCSLMLEGKILCTFEDIGRHNALDKVIGYALRNRIPMNECVIFTSGRISGDYMAKIIHAGMPIAVSRAAVTSEAIHLAKQYGVTLYGFVRGTSANLYT